MSILQAIYQETEEEQRTRVIDQYIIRNNSGDIIGKFNSWYEVVDFMRHLPGGKPGDETKVYRLVNGVETWTCTYEYNEDIEEV